MGLVLVRVGCTGLLLGVETRMVIFEMESRNFG